MKTKLNPTATTLKKELRSFNKKNNLLVKQLQAKTKIAEALEAKLEKANKAYYAVYQAHQAHDAARGELIKKLVAELQASGVAPLDILNHI